MNVRSRKPAVGSSRPSVSQIESPQVAYMSAVSSQVGDHGGRQVEQAAPESRPRVGLKLIF